MESLGKYLRGLRRDRRLTLGQLSRRADVNKATLSRWEAGTYTPRIPELLRVLGALDASPSVRSQALGLLDAPRAILAQRCMDDAPTLCISLGDALYGLRKRAGKTQSDVARDVGVSRSLVSQWENDAGRPTASALNDVGYSLGASAAEVAALSTHMFAEAPAEKSREALLQRCQQTMYWKPGTTEGSYTLHLLSLLAGVGRLIRAGRADVGDLALVVSKFGDCAEVWGRDPALPDFLRRRALALASESHEPMHFHLVPAVVSQLNPKADLGALPARIGEALSWQTRFPTKAGQAYLLSFVAKALAEEAPDEALHLGERALALVTDDPDEYPCRLRDMGNLLRLCGRAADSVAFIAALRPPDKFREGLKHLEMAEGLVALGSVSDAALSLASASQILSGCGSVPIQARIERTERALT